MFASEIINRARNVLHDETAVRWLDAEMLRWLSDAMREVAVEIPESYVVTANTQVLANKLRQDLPAAATRLFDITRNMGAAGTTPGSVIRLVDRAVLDSMDPDWPITSGTPVEHYMYDFKQPLKYMVYPPQAADIFVESVYGSIPPPVTAVTDAIPLSDIYASALLDGLLFRAYSKDAEVGNMETAAAYKASFSARLDKLVAVTSQRTPADTAGGSQA